MNKLYQEILAIPEQAIVCYEKNKGITLPENVPYLGMGASYHAALTLFYNGKNIQPRIASEYSKYLAGDVAAHGVLISQSGESTDTLETLNSFSEVTAITNHPTSTLAVSEKVKSLIELFAGEEEQLSSTKTYINTLITLYIGLGINPIEGIEVLKEKFNEIDMTAKQHAEQFASYIQNINLKGLNIIGSGPNIATAMQGALTFSETTKRAWSGLAIAQYDHGPKEAANDSVVIILNAHGKDEQRISPLKHVLKDRTNAHVLELKAYDLAENLTPLIFITTLNFIMTYLADALEIDPSFTIGDKVTKTAQ